MANIQIQTTPSRDWPLAQGLDWLRESTTNPLPKYTGTAVDLVALGANRSVADMTIGEFIDAAADPMRAVEAGIAARGKATVPSSKTRGNYKSLVNRIRRDLVSVVGAPEITQVDRLVRLTHRQKRASYARFPMSDDVRDAIEGYVEGKGQHRTVHFVEDGRPQTLQLTRWKPPTQEMGKAVLTRLARIASAALGGIVVALVDLLLPNTINAALERYERDGRVARAEAAAHPGGRGVAFEGHAFRERLFMFLDMFVREYVRVRHPDVYAKVVEAGALEYYKAQRSVARLNAKDATRLKPDVSRLEPRHLAAFTKDFWSSYGAALPPHHKDAGISGRRLRRAFLALALLAEAPIRMKNLVGLLVDCHLVLEGDRWWIRLPANELKNGGACQRGRPYTRRLSKPMSDVISRFIAEMKEAYGADIFTRVALLQSPEGGKEGQATSSSLGPDMAKLVEAKYGVGFSPHRARDVVATYLIKWAPQRRLDGFNLAAAALGDDPKTVVAKYYSFSDDGLDEYTESLHECDPSDDEGDDVE